MSAIGQGVTLICGNQLDGYAGSPPASGVREAMVPVTFNPFDEMTLSHYVGRKAWQILISDDNGAIQTGFIINQTLGARPAPDTVFIKNQSVAVKNVFISIRWQENSTEAALFSVGGLNDEQQTRTSTVGNVSITLIPGGD
jgi:hypothetical protein